MPKSQPSIDRGVPQGVTNICMSRRADPSFLHFVLSRAAHVILRKHNSTECCPAREEIVGVANNYSHC